AAPPPAAAPLPARPLRAGDRRAPDHGSVCTLLRRPGRARQGRDPALGGGVSGEPLGLNDRAWEMADRMAAHAAALRILARPLRAHARVERELFAKLGYAETAPRGVLVLETRNPPTEAVAAWVAAKAGLVPAHLTFVVAPTASLAGGVQITARILETGLHKMDTLGFDLK